ncbi:MULTISPECIES: DUF3152 domain-containing protein [Streptomyces]|uniref:DUF3152 domain-containing protein n=1 Tax=Streptomyces microflavus TaxID=1919 RepID=A0A7H8MRX9_STRMI|nr:MULTISPECIES: DUF3152 domain-containing protein [Streptomyces]MBW3360395.1 DUF3152 domain-containing protein [Streptomyces sp. 09ZI22]MEE1731073.1 DUF3152 domain-containing protein [Streptomyces sp. BE282]QKW44752.1 DUF3152 domain-containing protein [Streptomyces microflavus]WSR93207.1 DUF3152 domain-containing protein [Streptomyces microflavus]
MTGRRGLGTLPRDEPARDTETFRLRALPGPRTGDGGPGRRSASRSLSRPGSGSRSSRSDSRSRSRERRRRRNRRRTAGLVVLALAAVALVAVIIDRPWRNGDPSVTAGAGPGTGSGDDNAEAPVAPAPPPAAPASPTPSPPAGDRPPSASDVPASGPGTFTVARAGVTESGKGEPYRVEVEDGIGVDPDRAAEEIAAILADPRGWSHGGERTFRQVADRSAGLVVKIGTPATTDRLCGAYGLKTRGEVNCRGGEQVMVNLKRWQLGSPQFDGPVAEYRALIINHEVGHWLGRGHETCPGKGRPAPAMMQQIDGLKGCVANAWPYDAEGRYLGGPKVP